MMIAITVRTFLVSCAKVQARKKDRIYPPPPTKIAYTMVLGKTFRIKMVSEVNREI